MAEPRTTGNSGRNHQNGVLRALRAVNRVLPHNPARSGSNGASPPDLKKKLPVVDCGLYVDGHRVKGRPDYADALREAEKHHNAFVWLGLKEPTEEQMQELAEVFELHPLAVEDAVTAHQRPKLERYGETMFVVLKTARYVEHPELTATSEVVETGDVMLFIGRHFVLTVRHGDACHLSGVRAELDQSDADLLRQGPWAVFHAVCDNIVDRYLEVAEAIEDDIDEIEADVFTPGATDVRRIYNLKREIIEFKRAVVPLARPLDALYSGRIGGVPLEIRRYIRDIADHVRQVTEMQMGFDDLLNSALQADLAQIGVQQNNDMRKISAWVAMAAVPTMIAGIYGMNFDFMPELKWHFGYFAVLLVMAAAVALIYWLLRRSRWL
ncbi:magnesium and cobalt transport protein CorA [Fodinicola acaciae]|uniref:magnesium and cobalt transport protein CorA n=1 Tax=Fodinicola acaciae TaxID=2681555 RepID=UPI0013CFE769|nr:magnesium and cobalt transport protein CorA [Fodinicola acaciae]